MSFIKKLFPASFKRKVRSLMLRGNFVTCPCCGTSFVAFLPVPGSSPRAHAQCPECDCYERHRLLWLYIRDKTSIFASRDMKILHTAPEAIFYKKFKSMFGANYCPIDKFTKGYSYPSGTMNMDITDLKFADNTFDVVISNHVLEHVPDDRLAMREFFRVLKPGGLGFIQIPLDNGREHTYEDSINTAEARLKAFGQFDHLRIYGRDFKTRLEEAGFKVEVSDFAKSFSRGDAFKYGLDTKELLFVCQK